MTHTDAIPSDDTTRAALRRIRLRNVVLGALILHQFLHIGYFFTFLSQDVTFNMFKVLFASQVLIMLEWLVLSFYPMIHAARNPRVGQSYPIWMLGFLFSGGMAQVVYLLWEVFPEARRLRWSLMA